MSLYYKMKRPNLGLGSACRSLFCLSSDALEYAEAILLYNFLYNIDLSTIIRKK